MNIVVIRFSSLGDCILLCPFLEHLKEHGADNVTVVTKRAFVELFSAAVGVDRIVALEPRGGMRGLMTLADSQRGRDAVVIDAHNNWRSRFVSMRLGGADARIEKYYRQRVELIVLKEQHQIPTMSDRYSALCAPLGMPPVEQRAGGLAIAPAVRERADSLVGERSRPFVVLAPGSRWPMKEWSAQRFATLARTIVEEHGRDVVLLGDGGDAVATRQVAAGLDGAVLDLAGKTSIVEGAALLQRAEAFVGNDSGLMHLAEAMGVPVLALFGPTVDAFGYYPSLPDSKVVERKLDCRPCSRNGGRQCPLGTHACLEGIPVEPVASALSDLLNRRGPDRYVLN